MYWNQFGGTATQLPDGTVLLVSMGAEVYDPATQTSTPTVNSYPYGCCTPAVTATLLNNGKVLLTGGADAYRTDLGTPRFYGNSKLYDPATRKFTFTSGAPITARVVGTICDGNCGATATLLANGKVLITGGLEYDFLNPFANDFSSQQIVSKSAELYDPATDTFSATAGPMNIARMSHTATLLPDGRVLIAGGYIDTFGDGTNSSEIYDPGTGMFSFTKDPSGLTTGLLEARDNHTATLLPDGTVLFTGGSSATNLGNKLVCPADCFGKSTVELYQPSSAISGPTLVSISVSPAGFNSLRVVPVRFIATGAFSDGTTREVLTSSVTWTVSDPNVVSMSADGEAWVGIPTTSPETITITAAVPGSAAPPAQTTITIE